MSQEPGNNEKRSDFSKKLREKYDQKYNKGLGMIYKRKTQSELIDILLEKNEEIAIVKVKNEKLERQIQDLKRLLRQYEPEKGDLADYSGYNPHWPNVRKVVFILRRNFHSLTCSQVVEIIMRLEPDYKYGWSDPENQVAKLLGRACKYGLVKKIKNLGMGSALFRPIRISKDSNRKTDEE